MCPNLFVNLISGVELGENQDKKQHNLEILFLLSNFQEKTDAKSSQTWKINKEALRSQTLQIFRFKMTDGGAANLTK